MVKDAIDVKVDEDDDDVVVVLEDREVDVLLVVVEEEGMIVLFEIGKDVRDDCGNIRVSGTLGCNKSHV